MGAVLTDTYGGVTAYQRSPAKGLRREEDGEVVADEILIYEVMVDSLDHAWWTEFREAMRRRFGQEKLVVRALPMERL